MTAPASGFYRRVVEGEIRRWKAERRAQRRWRLDLGRAALLVLAGMILVYLTIYVSASGKGADLSAGIVANAAVALAFYGIIARNIENRHDHEQKDEQHRIRLSFVLSQYHQLLSQVHTVQRLSFDAGDSRGTTSTTGLSHIASELRHTANVLLDVGSLLKGMGEENAKETAYQDVVNSIAVLALKLVRNEPLLGVEEWIREQMEDLVTLHPDEFSADAHLKRSTKLLKHIPRRVRSYKQANPDTRRSLICDLADASGHICALMADSLVERFVARFKPLRERLASEEEPALDEDRAQLSLFDY